MTPDKLREQIVQALARTRGQNYISMADAIMALPEIKAALTPAEHPAGVRERLTDLRQRVEPYTEREGFSIYLAVEDAWWLIEQLEAALAGPSASAPLTHDQIIDALFEDILDRRGIKWEFEKIDESVRGEIRAAWKAIIWPEKATQPAPEPLRSTANCGKRVGDLICERTVGHLGRCWSFQPQVEPLPEQPTPAPATAPQQED